MEKKTNKRKFLVESRPQGAEGLFVTWLQLNFAVDTDSRIAWFAFV